MNKKEFINKLAETQSISKKQAADNLSAVLDTITDVVVNHDGVQFIGWGSFNKSTRVARKGVNPSTGKSIDIAASTVCKFKAGQTFKDELNK